MMAGSKHPIFAEFIEDLRELWGQKLPEHDHWEKVQVRLGILIKDESLQAACRDWPGKRGEELILYHDPDHGFFIGGLVRPREHLARPHDHAHTWTAYGVLDGTEKTTLYARTDDGSVTGKATIEISAQYDAPAGHVDVVPPWQIHAESNNGERSVAITVRTEQPGGYAQNMFFPDGTTDKAHRGLKLIPFPLSG